MKYACQPYVRSGEEWNDEEVDILFEIISSLSGLGDLVMGANRINPIHPGEILLEEFLKPMNLSQNRIALDMRVPARRINEIVQGKRRITADTALRLAKFFNTSAQFWLGLQMDFDLDITEDIAGERIEKEVHTYRVSA